MNTIYNQNSNNRKEKTLERKKFWVSCRQVFAIVTVSYTTLNTHSHIHTPICVSITFPHTYVKNLHGNYYNHTYIYSHTYIVLNTNLWLNFIYGRFNKSSRWKVEYKSCYFSCYNPIGVVVVAISIIHTYSIYV